MTRFITAIPFAFSLALLASECLRRLQLGSYRISKNYFALLCSKYFVLLCVLSAAGLIPYLFFYKYSAAVSVLQLLFGVVLLFVKRKPRLKYTKRIVRQIIANVIIFYAAALSGAGAVLPVTIPFMCVLSFLLCLPAEKCVARYYYVQAKKKLNAYQGTKIAITGSYGKTSVKCILSALLDDCAASPLSYNTVMGLVKFINETDISDKKYLIFEMGARRRGDIAELCRLVNPQVGILTGIAPQHLETFKTLENVVAAKTELPSALPKNGFCVYNGCDPVVLSKCTDAGTCRKYIAGTGNFYRTENFSATTTMSEFDLITPDCGVVHVESPLISLSNAENTALSVAVCALLGENVSKIVEKCKLLKQIPHRMEVMDAGEITVIDDSYNANISGVKACCETLKIIGCRTIVVTQGIAEAGKSSSKLNREVGKMLGEVVAAAFVTGSNAEYLAEGLKCGNAEIIFCKNVDEAVALMRPYLKSGTAVLFQNDLPDNI